MLSLRFRICFLSLLLVECEKSRLPQPLLYMVLRLLWMDSRLLYWKIVLEGKLKLAIFVRAFLLFLFLLFAWWWTLLISKIFLACLLFYLLFWIFYWFFTQSYRNNNCLFFWLLRLLNRVGVVDFFQFYWAFRFLASFGSRVFGSWADLIYVFFLSFVYWNLLWLNVGHITDDHVLLFFLEESINRVQAVVDSGELLEKMVGL